jgi:hypothetical protein
MSDKEKLPVKTWDFEDDGEFYQHAKMSINEEGEGDYVLTSDYRALLEREKRLRESALRVIKMIDYECKHNCHDWYKYGKHAPECRWDWAAELKDALKEAGR